MLKDAPYMVLVLSSWSWSQIKTKIRNLTLVVLLTSHRWKLCVLA